MANVRIENMAAEIMREMEKYGEAVADDVKAAAKKIGKETAK